MPDKIRVLNESGIERFRSYLQALREGATDNPPNGLLESLDTSDMLMTEMLVEYREYKSHLELARYLSGILALLDSDEVARNVGLWSWLTLYFFNLTCPRKRDGSRAPGRDYRHIPDKSRLYAHRHLLSGPYHVYSRHGENARLMLCAPVHQENRFFHELCSRQSFVSNDGLVGAADALYFNPSKGIPKRRAAVANEPGSLLRFISVIQQLDLTYDLYSLSAEQILQLLPSEFDEWNPIGPFTLQMTSLT